MSQDHFLMAQIIFMGHIVLMTVACLIFSILLLALFLLCKSKETCGALENFNQFIEPLPSDSFQAPIMVLHELEEMNFEIIINNEKVTKLLLLSLHSPLCFRRENAHICSLLKSEKCLIGCQLICSDSKSHLNNPFAAWMGIVTLRKMRVLHGHFPVPFCSFLFIFNGPGDVTTCPSAQKNKIAENCSKGQFQFYKTT